MSKKPTFIAPNNALKRKVGEGGIPSHTLKKCQDYLESNPVDFTPYGLRYLDQLKQMKSLIAKGDVDQQATSKFLVDTVMQMKSNGSMFHYQLVSMVSDVMLRFLEEAKKLDKDFVDIFTVYINVLDIILNKRLTGNGGKEGYALTQELHNACLRYYAKHEIPV